MATTKIMTISDPLGTDQLDSRSRTAVRKEWIKNKLKQYGLNRPLKVLIGSNSLACGGAEYQILRLMPNLIDLGLHVEHAYYGAPHVLKPRFDAEALNSTFFDRKRLGQVKFWRKIVSWMRAKEFDIVHSFSESANFYIRGAAVLAKVPVILAGWRNRYLNKSPSWILPLSGLNYFTQAWIINSASNCEALNILPGRTIKTYVVPNALNFDDQDYSIPKPLDYQLSQWVNGRPIIGAIGRIAKQKNFDLFLDVAKKIHSLRPHVCFMIVGGPAGDPASLALERHLNHRIIAEKLTSFVRMTGRSDDVPGFLPNLTVLLCTSDFEGCPNVVMEAMRAKVAIVMTDCCDLSLLIESGKNGFVAPVGDSEELSSKVIQLIDDPVKRKRFGRLAMEKAKNCFRAENSSWLLALIYLREWERYILKTK